MNWQELDAAIDDFESMIHAGEGLLSFDSFRPAAVWAKAALIQEGFRGVRYPTKQERTAAWVRFNALRDEASARSQAERDKKFYKSKQWRDIILDQARSETFSFFSDNLIPPRAGVEEMKGMGRRLRQTWQFFTEHKQEMNGDHKQECFAALQEAQESQDRWWDDYKRSAAEHRRERINSTIEKLQEKLRGAYATLAKMESAADDLRDKITSAWSESYTERATGWLAELEEKIDTQKEHIARLEGWLQEEEDKL